MCSSTRLYDGPDQKIQERVYQKACAICSESSRKLSRVIDLARRLSSSGKYKSLCFNKKLESALRYPLYRKQSHAKDTYRSVVARSRGEIFKIAPLEDHLLLTHIIPSHDSAEISVHSIFWFQNIYFVCRSMIVTVTTIATQT